MAAVSTISVGVDTSEALKKAVRQLLKNQVLVGIPDGAAERQAEPGVESQPSNALLGYVHEFGSDEHNIPPRPFLVPGVEGAKDQIVARMRQAGEAALNGTDAVGRGLNAVGLVAQNAVQEKITEGPFAPLAERTLEARRAKGRTGERPLIDTGQLRRSITYVVLDKSSA